MRKLFLFVTCILLACTLLFAGGSSESSNDGRTEITLWAFPTLGNSGDVEREIIAAFEEANPDIKVNFETIDFTSGPNRITAAIEGGAAPDIVLDAPGRIIEWGKNGILAPLDDLFTDEYKADISEGLLNSCTDGEHYYMYPLSSAPFWMSINKEMWEDAGAWQYVNTEGDRCWTTEDFYNAMVALGNAGYIGVNVYCGGQGGDQGTRALVNNLFSGHIYEDGKWVANTPETVDALEMLLELYNAGAIDFGRSMVAADELQLYQFQQIASTICWGTSNAVNYATDAFTQFSVPFPSDDGVPELEYLANGFCVFDNGDAAKIEASKKLIQFFCDDPVYGPKAVVASAAFPAHESFGNLYEGNDEYALLASWTKYYGPYYNTEDNFSQMRTQWWNLLQYISTGDKSVEQAVVDFDNLSNATN